MLSGYGCVAQLVEQLTLNQWVWGSNPHAPTIIKRSALCRPFYYGLEALGENPRHWGLTTSESDTGVSRSALADERLCHSSEAQSNPHAHLKKSDTGVSRSASADERLCHSSGAQSNPHAPTSLQVCIIKKGPLCAGLS